MILRKILSELQEIRKELRDLKKNMEFHKLSDSDIFQEVIKQAKFSQRATGKNPFLLD